MLREAITPLHLIATGRVADEHCHLTGATQPCRQHIARQTGRSHVVSDDRADCHARVERGRKRYYRCFIGTCLQEQRRAQHRVQRRDGEHIRIAAKRVVQQRNLLLRRQLLLRCLKSNFHLELCRRLLGATAYRLPERQLQALPDHGDVNGIVRNTQFAQQAVQINRPVCVGAVRQRPWQQGPG